jgi:chemotaxis protein CheX
MEDKATLNLKNIKNEEMYTYFFPGNNLKDKIVDPDCIFYQMDPEFSRTVDSISMIRKVYSFIDTPIILLTSFSQLEKARKMLTKGVSEVLVYPQETNKILSTVNRSIKPVGERIPIDIKIINPFIESTINLMSTMAGMSVVRKDLYLKKNYSLFGEISGIMNFSGNIRGSVVVCFSMDLAKEIVSSIMGFSVEELTDLELKEGVGEIVNIISGNAKVALAETEYCHQITLPSVITGVGHEINHPENAPCIVVIFEASGKTFAIQVSLIVNK